MALGLFSKKDINQGVQEWKATHGAVLLDVRSREEYRERHIEGSVNLPLNELERISQTVPNKSTPIFVHCLSGARSANAEQFLKKSGYQTVKNIGGISSYRGKTI